MKVVVYYFQAPTVAGLDILVNAFLSGVPASRVVSITNYGFLITAGGLDPTVKEYNAAVSVLETV